MVWHGIVRERLRASGLFTEVSLIGAKVRATLSETLFLDIHHDPTTGSYSYALIDLTSPHPGDKRILGWDYNPRRGRLSSRGCRDDQKAARLPPSFPAKSDLWRVAL